MLFYFTVELLLGNNDKPLAVLNKNWHHIVDDLSLHSVETPVVFLRRNVHYPVEKEKQITDPIVLKYLFSDVSNFTVKNYKSTLAHVYTRVYVFGYIASIYIMYALCMILLKLFLCLRSNIYSEFCSKFDIYFLQ